jgi:4-amino-4-deoxy-L-arabinose transferase-like glycosyltransferase
MSRPTGTAGTRGGVVAQLSSLGGRHPWMVALAIATVLRLILLSDRPLWYDEAFAVLFSAKGPAAMLYGTLSAQAGAAADVHPIFYYTLLWAWQTVFGSGPLAVRALSMGFGLATVLLAYLLARDLFGERGARVGSLLVACAPFQVHYSQEARMYALLGLLLFGATWVYWRALHAPGWRDWLLFGLLAGMAQYAHNLAFAFLLPLTATSLLVNRWRAFRRTLVAGCLALVVYAPWLLQLPAQWARIERSYWIPAPGPAEMVRTLLAYLGGLPVPDWGLPILLTASILLVVVAGLTTLRAIRRRDAGSLRGAWLAYLASVPPLVLFLVSQWHPVYLDRALLPAGGMFLLWVGWALSAQVGDAKLIRFGWLAVGVAFALGLFGYYTYRGFPYAPFAALDSDLRREIQGSEIVLHGNKITALPCVYYGPDLAHHYLEDPTGTASDTLAVPTQEVLGLLADPDAASAVRDADGVWFVVFRREIDEYIAAGMVDHPALAWLRGHMALAEVRPYGDLDVYHFTRRRLSAR